MAKIHLSPEDFEKWQKVNSILEKEFSCLHTISLLARSVGTNENKLIKGFKFFTNTTIHVYVTLARLEKANVIDPHQPEPAFDLKKTSYMQEIQSLSGFLRNGISIYYNPTGVGFYRNEDCSLFVSCHYPGIEQKDKIFLELFQEVKNARALMTLLHLTTIEDLDAVTAQDLIGLYEQEKLHIVCTLDGYLQYGISFKKYKNKLWARNTDEDIHEVKKQLQRPDDFISYTVGYYTSRGVMIN